MGVANRYIFRNGSTIKPIGSTIHVARGSTKSSLVVDEFLKILTPEELMEWVIEDSHLVIKKKDIPDFGEFESSKDILEYIGGGANAGDIRRHS